MLHNDAKMTEVSGGSRALNEVVIVRLEVLYPTTYDAAIKNVHQGLINK